MATPNCKAHFHHRMLQLLVLIPVDEQLATEPNAPPSGADCFVSHLLNHTHVIPQHEGETAHYRVTVLFERTKSTLLSVKDPCSF